MASQTMRGALIVKQGGVQVMKISADTIKAVYPYQGNKASYFCTGGITVTGAIHNFTGPAGTASTVIEPGTRVPTTGSAVRVEDVRANRLAGTERQINVHIR